MRVVGYIMVPFRSKQITMGTIQRPLHYFSVTFTILRNGQPYGYGNMKTENIDLREQGLNRVKSTIIQRMHNEMPGTFTYVLIRMIGQTVTKAQYDVLKDDITFD